MTVPLFKDPDALKIGDRVSFRFEREWFRGTVRATDGSIPGHPFRCDDGEPADPNMDTNGWTCSAWLPAKDVRKGGGGK